MRFRTAISVVLLGLVPGALSARAATVQVGGREFAALKQATTATYDASLRFAAAPAMRKPFSALFAYGPEGHYEVALGRDGAELAKVSQGVRAIIARSGNGPRAPRLLVFRRQADQIVVMADGLVVLRAIDSTFGTGVVLAEVGEGVPAVEDAVVLRREPVFFSDDFMVDAKGAKADRGWRGLAGSWECKSVRPEEVAAAEAYYERSSNPFAYLGTPAGKEFALTVRGEPWWSDYSYRASVKCVEAGAAGIVFGCEGEATFWVVRLECRGRFAVASRLQLVRSEGGVRKVVAECHVPAAFGRWYGLAVEVYPARVRVGFCGSEVMDVVDARVSGGPIGLYAEGAAGAVFDDVEVAELGRFRFDRAEDLRLFGQQVAGAWRVREGDGGSRAELVARGRDCMALFGNDTWEGGAVTAEVQSDGRMAGVVAGADGRSAYLLALKPRGKGAVILRAPDGEKELAEFSYDGDGDGWCRAALNLSEAGVISAFVGGGLVARVKAPGPVRGRVGVFARDASGSAFRNVVANRSARLLAAHQIGNAVFLTDAYMSTWATEKGQWVPDDGVDRALSMPGSSFEGKNVFWRKGDYYGDCVMALPLTIAVEQPVGPDGVQPPPVHTPITGALAVHFCLESGELGSGYAVAAKTKAPGEYDLVLLEKGKPLAAAAGLRVDEKSREVLIYKSGKYLWAKFGDRELFLHRMTEPPTGTRIAAVRNGAVDFNRLAVYAENLDDSSFERAPTNWTAVGDWQITNRFRCDPRWSWMGVDSMDGHAAVWNRREFWGDLTFEVYGSMKMRTTSPCYVPSDLNVTICGARESPDSGYTFVVGGWRNERTAILRNGREVAATKEVYLPDTRDGFPGSEMLHRRWFYVKARRKGAKVELFLDNRKFLDYTDPEPLPGGKVGVWTQEQSIMVARAQVFYSRSVLPPQAVETPRAEAAEAKPAVAPLRVTCPGRPGYFFDFEDGVQGWGNYAGAGGAMAVPDTEVVGRRGGDASLRLVNAECAGRFIAAVPVGPFNVLACPELSFDCRIPRGVMVNLYFDVPTVGATGGRTYFIALTGPEESTEGVKSAGRFENAAADGRWRRVTVDLARAMRQFYPTAAAAEGSNFRLGMDHRATYAVSGIGGNPKDAAYHVDNFLLVTAAAGRAVLQWAACTAPHSGYAFRVTDDADSDPGNRVNLTVPSVTVEADGSGLRFLHVRPVLTNARRRAPVAHFPLYDAGARMEAIQVGLPDQARWGGERVAMQLRLAQLAALDASSVRATVGSASARLDGRTLAMDWSKGVLTLDSSGLPLRLDDGAVVNFSLTARAFGQAEPTAESRQWVASLAYDRTAPGPVVIDGHPALDDFEEGVEGWTTDGHTVAGIDRTAPAAGRGALSVFSRDDGGRMSVFRSCQDQRVGAVPVVEFDYKLAEDARPDLVFRTGSGPWAFKLRDNTSANQIGRIADAVADGQWHHASVDTFDSFWHSARMTLCSPLSGIGFGDLGWPSTRAGDRFWIDNFRLVPVASSRGGLQVKWRANDLLGVAGYSYVWSAKAEDEAPKQIMVAADGFSFRDLPEGRQYLHVRAVDRAGNWGPTTHAAFIIDNTAPQVAEIRPRPGSKCAPTRYTLTVNDEHGPDPAALRLTVDGKAYTFHSATLSSTRRPSIVWELAQVPEEIAAVPNGKAMEFALSGVQDFAGNAAEAVNGTWTMDWSQDRQPPQRAEFEPLSCETGLVRRFDQDLDGAAAQGYATVQHLVAREPLSRALCITPTHPGQQAVMLANSGFDLAKTGVISVDVDLPGGRPVYLDLLVVGNGFRCKVRMGDQVPTPPKPGTVEADNYTYVGDMNDIRSGAGWHTQWVDLYALVKGTFPGLSSYTVTNIGFGRMCAPFHAGGHIWLDNVMAYGYGKNEMRLRLRSRDVTGISGYAVSVGPALGGAVERKVGQAADEVVRTVGRGVWYVKALACDNNGNWSQVPGVFPYVVVTDPPRAEK